MCIRDSFTTEAGHANQVAPGKRPSHTIIPAFAMNADGTPQMAFGVMGGPMQSQGHVQMAVRVLRYGQNPQAAADAPRWRVTGGNKVSVEPGLDPQVVEAPVSYTHLHVYKRQAFNKAIQTPEVTANLAKLGADVAKPGTPAQFADMVKADSARWAKVIKDNHITLE